MCVYCFVGDNAFKWDPPWDVGPMPYVPTPLVPVKPWGIERLLEFEEMLKRIKELEDKVDCPCEPNKADYLKMVADRIKELREMG